MTNEIRTKHEQVTVTGEMFIITGKKKEIKDSKWHQNYRMRTTKNYLVDLICDTFIYSY